MENDLISVHQAAENGTYETFNLYLSEIAEIYAKKNIPKFYIKMKNKIINSSFYIDGQKLDRFLAAEVDGRDYNLNEFRKAYQLLVENISDYSLEDAAMIVGNDEKWKIKREIKDKVIPLLFLLLLTASYFIILYFLGGVGL